MEMTDGMTRQWGRHESRHNEMRTNILRFNVSVNEIAFIMKILKAEKYLLRDDLNEGFWNTLLLVALN